MNPVASFSGLASGVQWRDIIDQLLKVEQSRTLDPVTRQLDERAEAKKAWARLRTLVADLNSAARDVRRGGIGGYLATAAASPTTSRTLVNVSATAAAQPGRYGVEVLQLAQAAKVSGEGFASTSTALGLTGDFTVNGSTVSVAAGDSLTAIRDKINALNTGPTATKVSASILADRNGGGRLVLTAQEPGAAGLTLGDGTGGIARELGFLDSESRAVSSTMMAMAAALGLQVTPPPASIRVGGQVVTVDLATDSMAEVVRKITAAGAQASIATEPNGGGTASRIIVDGNVQAVDGDANSAAVVAAMGFTAGSSRPVRQTVATAAFTAPGGAAATGTTRLVDLQVGGQPVGLVAGDAINIRGTRGDGSSVTIGLTVGADDTLDTLLARINDATSGFGAGSRPATATLGADGRIRLTDGTAGESRLGLSLQVAKADGTPASLGATTTTVVGRPRQPSAGQDAQFRVDGVLFTRTSNTVADAIPGVSLTLAAAEPGTTVDVTVNRNTEGAVAAVKKFADAYNAIGKFLGEQRAADAPLAGTAALRQIMASFTEGLRTAVPDNATYGQAPLVGLALDRNGVLGVDESAFRAALAARPEEVERLFGFGGIGSAVVSATDRATAFGTGTISAQERSIDEQTRRLDARAVEARRRLDLRRRQLTQEFTRMEQTLSRLNAQGSWLASQVRMLQPAS